MGYLRSIFSRGFSSNCQTKSTQGGVPFLCFFNIFCVSHSNTTAKMDSTKNNGINSKEIQVQDGSGPLLMEENDNDKKQHHDKNNTVANTGNNDTHAPGERTSPCPRPRPRPRRISDNEHSAPRLVSSFKREETDTSESQQTIMKNSTIVPNRSQLEKTNNRESSEPRLLTDDDDYNEKTKKRSIMTHKHDLETKKKLAAVKKLKPITKDTKNKEADGTSLMLEPHKSVVQSTGAASSKQQLYRNEKLKKPRHQHRLEQQKLAAYNSNTNNKNGPSKIKNDRNVMEDYSLSLILESDETRTQISASRVATSSSSSKVNAHSKKRADRVSRRQAATDKTETAGQVKKGQKGDDDDSEPLLMEDESTFPEKLRPQDRYGTENNDSEDVNAGSFDEIRPGAVRVLGMELHDGVESTRNILMDDIQTLQDHQQVTSQTLQATESLSNSRAKGSTHDQNISSGQESRSPYGGMDVGTGSDDEPMMNDDGPIVAQLAPDEEDVAQQVQTQVAQRLEREREKQIVVEAEELEEDNTKKILFILLLLLVVVGGTLLLLFLLDVIGAKDATEMPTSDPSAVPTAAPTDIPTRFEQLIKLLIDVSGANEETLRNNSTDQYQALAWLADEDLYYGDTEFHEIEPQRLVERYSLAVLYFSSNGELWNESYDFLSDTSVCEWQGNGTDDGVTCFDGIDSDVVKVNLPNNNLVGRLPSELALLTSMEEIIFNKNDFSESTIPTEMFSMSNLNTFWINGCSLAGTIPSTGLSRMTLLTSMDLGNNVMTGNLPTEMGLWTSMVDLRLDDNQFLSFFPSELSMMKDLTRLHLFGNFMLGFLPTEVGAMTSMVDLQLASNFFFGSLPSEIGTGMTSLTLLDIDDCGFSGMIPTEVGQLVGLTALRLGSNDFTGTLPTELRSLTSLELFQSGHNELSSEIRTALGALPTRLTELHLNNNQFSSTVPSDIGRLTLLTDLRLGNNGLTGNLPYEITQLDRMRIFHLDNTDISGSLPDGFQNWVNMIELRLNSNRFVGSFLSQIVSLEHLKILDLSGNDLTGFMPPEIGLLVHLEEFDLSGNTFYGAFPSEVVLFERLQTLNLAGSSLSGTIPSEVGLLTSLQIFNIARNDLTGTIPSEVGSMVSLRELDLSSNPLTGTIPSEVGLLTSLQRLFLDGNPLNGTIPSEVGMMENLQTFVSVFNLRMKGPIPTEIGLMKNLQTLDLFSSGLTGHIPSEIGLATSLQNFYTGNNELIGSIPTEVGNLGSLVELTFDQNFLSGSLPSELGKLENLEYLLFATNNLSGTLPTELSQATALEFLYLNDNLFTGTLPTEFGLFSEMVELWLDGVYIDSCSTFDHSLWPGLSGTIPTELGQLAPTLRSLWINGNSLEGTLPTEFGLLTNLHRLVLNGNRQLTGTIPTDWSALDVGNTFDFFWLQRTNITGSADHLCPSGTSSSASVDLFFDCVVNCSCCIRCCNGDDELPLFDLFFP